MKIATWNVNSLRVRLPQVLDWLQRQRPDVLCVQETKIEDKDFPHAAINEAGYEVVYCGQKTYNGVAIISRDTPDAVVTALPGAEDVQKRLIVATVGGVRIINVYVPNGAAVGSEKYAYKLDWLQRLTDYLAAELERHALVAVLGDYNIAPEDRDVHDPGAWEGSVLVSDEEREAWRGLRVLGLADVFRQFEQPEGSYSWWDYRAAAFRRNMGLRIDHILCNAPLAQRCQACYIDTEPRRLPRPSDHAPVVAELD